jgi:hypothetical protein
MLLKWNREEINNLVRNTLINCKTMRKKNVLMSAIAALAFAACSSDDVLLEQDTGIVTNPTGNAWVALDIKTPSVSRSRALHDPNKEDGTAEESSLPFNEIRGKLRVHDAETNWGIQSAPRDVFIFTSSNTISISI